MTEAEVRAAHLRDRREESEAEWAGSSPSSSREIGPEPRRLERGGARRRIEASIERLIRRREQLGPVNPLAEREYEEAKEHVEELEAQREDLEKALTELAKLIRETDREIPAAFEETFEAAQKNFEELIEHMFPGGRGRLRLVEPQRQARVLGGAEADDERTGTGAAEVFREAGTASAPAEGAAEADPDASRRGRRGAR